MKTMTLNDKFRRVTEENATRLHKRGWKYSPKWKALKPGERQVKKRGKS